MRLVGRQEAARTSVSVRTAAGAFLSTFLARHRAVAEIAWILGQHARLLANQPVERARIANLTSVLTAQPQIVDQITPLA